MANFLNNNPLQSSQLKSEGKIKLRSKKCDRDFQHAAALHYSSSRSSIDDSEELSQDDVCLKTVRNVSRRNAVGGGDQQTPRFGLLESQKNKMLPPINLKPAQQHDQCTQDRLLSQIETVQLEQSRPQKTLVPQRIKKSPSLLLPKKDSVFGNYMMPRTDTSSTQTKVSWSVHQPTITDKRQTLKNAQILSGAEQERKNHVAGHPCLRYRSSKRIDEWLQNQVLSVMAEFSAKGDDVLSQKSRERIVDKVLQTNQLL